MATDLRLYARRVGARAGRGDRPVAAGAVPARARARRHADARLHAPAARAAGDAGRTTCSRTPRCWRAIAGGCWTRERRAAESPLGSGALAGDGPADRSRGDRRGARVRGGPDAQQPGRRVRPRLRRRDRVRVRAAVRAPVAPGRGAGAVVDDGVRLRAPRRGLLLGQLADAAEAQPRHRRAAARQSRRA